MSQGFADIPAVPFTGNEIMTGEWPSLQARAAATHGPIYKWVIRSGMDAGSYIFMVGPEANRFVLHTHRDHFSHDRGWTPIIGNTMGKGLLNMDDPEHARHRKMWNPAFTSACMEAYLPVIQRVISERTRAWPERGDVDVYHEAREITFDAAAAALAGFQPGPAVDRLRELFYQMLYGGDSSTLYAYDDYLRRAMTARTELVGMLLNMIRTRRNTPATDQPRDVLSMIVHARDENGAALSDEQVLAHVNILLVAGHETTTTLSAWALYLLATQPEQRQKLAAELASVHSNANAPLPVESIRSLKLLDAFIKETGRLYSPVLNVPRGVVKEFEFGGYTVPEGAHVRLALAACHRLPHIFANPDTFDPDRFLPPREEDKRQQYSLVTFGGGPRICIGINFANVEVKALVAHVLRSFALEPVSNRRPIHAGHWTAMIPNGVWLRVRPA